MTSIDEKKEVAENSVEKDATIEEKKPVTKKKIVKKIIKRVVKKKVKKASENESETILAKSESKEDGVNGKSNEKEDKSKEKDAKTNEKDIKTKEKDAKANGKDEKSNEKEDKSIGKGKEEMTDESDEKAEEKHDEDTTEVSDIKKERAAEPKKEIYFIPSFDEFRMDITREEYSKIIRLGPLQLADLSNQNIFNVLQQSSNFDVHFYRDVDKDLEFFGYIEAVCYTEEECIAAKESLTDLREEIIIQRYDAFESKAGSSVTFPIGPVIGMRDNLGDCLRGRSLGKTLAMIDVPEKYTEEMIAEKIKNIRRVIIPKSFVTNENKRYAYIEFISMEEMEKMVGKRVELEPGVRLKLTTITKQDSFGVFARRCRDMQWITKRDRFTIRERDLLLELINVGSHYERVDYLKETEVKELEGIMKKLIDARKRDQKSRLAETKRYGSEKALGSDRGSGNDKNERSRNDRQANKRPAERSPPRRDNKNPRMNNRMRDDYDKKDMSRRHHAPGLMNTKVIPSKRLLDEESLLGPVPGMNNMNMMGNMNAMPNMNALANMQAMNNMGMMGGMTEMNMGMMGGMSDMNMGMMGGGMMPGGMMPGGMMGGMADMGMMNNMMGNMNNQMMGNVDMNTMGSGLGNVPGSMNSMQNTGMNYNTGMNNMTSSSSNYGDRDSSRRSESRKDYDNSSRRSDRSYTDRAQSRNGILGEFKSNRDVSDRATNNYSRRDDRMNSRLESYEKSVYGSSSRQENLQATRNDNDRILGRRDVDRYDKNDPYISRSSNSRFSNKNEMQYSNKHSEGLNSLPLEAPLSKVREAATAANINPSAAVNLLVGLSNMLKKGKNEGNQGKPQGGYNSQDNYKDQKGAFGSHGWC